MGSPLRIGSALQIRFSHDFSAPTDEIELRHRYLGALRWLTFLVTSPLMRYCSRSTLEKWC